MLRSAWIVALAFAAIPAACASSQSRATAQADAVTRAIYADDVAGVTSHLDVPVAAIVTRTEVGALSDRMHALGSYRSLQSVGGAMPRNEYIYQAVFDKGRLVVVVKLDPNGRLGAYRIVPQQH